ncbi:YesL family protein [Pseudalkalibacillus sp. A8]|uniref:YesL family protein n=1 Tax=Pseudalkalibacillus sp. A8 TaxID=3382641 RepID=UPI0038B57B1E
MHETPAGTASQANFEEQQRRLTVPNTIMERIDVLKGTNFKGKLFVLFEWITRMAYVNVLWIVFTVLGLVILGLFPATSAMFVLIRRWVRGEDDFSVFSLFWKTYKNDFWKANAFGWIMAGLGIILYLDYIFFSSSDTTLFFLLKSFTIMLLFVYGLILVMIFPVFAHYKLTLIHLFRNTIFIAMLHPLKSLTAISGITFIGFVMFLLPTLFPFFGGSLSALFLTWVAQMMFRKIDERQEEGLKMDDK